jgi:hypothetical protein
LRGLSAISARWLAAAPKGMGSAMETALVRRPRVRVSRVGGVVRIEMIVIPPIAERHG